MSISTVVTRGYGSGGTIPAVVTRGYIVGVPVPLPPPPVPPPTAAEIADALAGRFGPVVCRFRYEQRTLSFALLADLTPAVRECAIELDNDRRAVRTAEFRIDPSELPVDFDIAADHIAVSAEVLVLGVFVTFPLGLFRLDVPTELFRPNADEEIAIQATDVVSHLLQATLGTPLTIASGTNYVAAIRARLDGLGLEHSIPAVVDVTPVDFTFGPEQSEADVVDALTFAINRFPIWPDGEGVFTTRERIDPSTETADVIYATTVEPRMIRGDEPFEKREDRSRFANRVAVLIDDPNRAAAFALRLNDDPTSPISTIATGVTITEALSGGRVVDLATAGEIAEYELRDRAARSLIGVLPTLFDPRREAHEFYTLYVETEESGTLWRANGWRMNMATDSRMNHELGRAQSVDISTP